ncbi:hypothetical protein F383_12207 [Gossypium arboreum]|uniref:Uncharacterized protein n=1 Tax=Gossypium arboreum TaxID=29729 RepID=A0A0B0PZA5_GOSAR|nr:hypothetical protein F383_12207 [Gossypium arboreum]
MTVPCSTLSGDH